jgi:methylated-DNA-[protein]-cysteine S-methyltransferase
MEYYDHLETPIGRLALVANAQGALVRVQLALTVRPQPDTRVLRHAPDHLAAIHAQFSEWFNGHRIEFELPLAAPGTSFQQAVWSALREIGYGRTASYAEIACRIGRPQAVRAVGAANGANPLPIVVPCHRVIGANGSLTGYAGGLEAKRWLLRHEADHAPAISASSVS